MVNDLPGPTPSTQTEPVDLRFAIGARTLHAVLLGLLGLIALAVPAVVFVFVKKAANSILLLAMLALVLVAGVLARRGRVRLASLVLVSGTWLLCATIVVLSGGPTSPNNGMLIAVTFVAGLLLGPRAAILTGVASCAVGLCVLLLASLGIAPPQYFPLPPTAAWVATSLALLLALVPLYMALTSLAAALGEQRKEISERRTAETALRETNEKLAWILDVMPQPVCWADAEGRIQFWNRSAAEVFGYSPTEVDTIDRWLERAYPDPAYREAVAREWTERVRKAEPPGGRIEPREYQVTCKDGSVRSVEIGGAVVGGGRMLAVFDDVSESRRAERTLRERTALLRAQFDNSPDLILIVDREGRVIAINHTTTPGLSPEAVRGQDAAALLPPQEREKARKALRCCLETGEPQELEHLLMGDRTVHARISRLRWEGAADRLLIISTDITERTRLEAQLRDAQKMATMASIVGAVAHEVRNPLFALSATLDAFEARPEVTGDRQVFVDRLRQQVNRMSLLMQELLDYGRPYTPNLVIGPLRPVIARAVATHRRLADGRGVRLETDIPVELPDIALDAPRLLQVFENLIKNGIEHSTVGGVVRFEAREATEDGVRRVECRVRDAGPGFDGVDLDQVFEPFYSRRPGGTGLGLSIAWRITREHGGAITAGNHPEGGAVFTVKLPAAG